MIDLTMKRLNSILGIQATREYVLRLRLLVCIAALALLATGCGGGSSSSSSSSSKNPVPSLALISPTSAPAGSRTVILAVTGGNFISSSVVQWNGAARTTTFISSSQLTAQITPTDLAGAGSALVTVFNPAPGGGTSSSMGFSITSVDALSLLTARLPDITPGKEYSYALQASGGITPYTWTITSGSLPSGFSLSSAGVISGTASAISENLTYNITVQVADYAYQASTQTKSFSLDTRTAKLGRNDSCPNATPASNGAIRASISPFGDIDVYSFHGTAGNRITMEIYAQRLTLYDGSTTTDDFLDSFLEILDSDCSTLYYNDDIVSGVNTDSKISNFTLPSTGTYYIRVSDLRGDGRPDFIYELHLSGAD